MEIDDLQAQRFLAEHFDPSISGVERIGEGAWSRCFGFRRGDEELVARFGLHVDDFEADRRAYACATRDLPIPEVIDIARAFDGYCAIATRVHGEPLDHLDAGQWRAAIPSVVAMLETLRTTDLAATSGHGAWGRDGAAPHTTWSGHLLDVANDSPGRRTHGWRRTLAQSAEGEEAFAWGYRLLQRLADDSVPRHLIHADLMNRNVLVQDGRITGVLDWGCSCYGDHLYDLAWFEFWAPWYPEKDIAALRAALERRWREAGYVPHNKTVRLHACYLHIGLSHLAYNAWRGDWAALSATAARMRALVAGQAS
jgi:hygromycin-B 4-O-kinase